jgi:hypothetical protein
MEFRSKGKRRLLLSMISILLLGSSVLQAQSTGRLHGVVTDPSGAVIPGASISLKPKSGDAVATKSDGAGNYDVKGLRPGTYSVSVTAEGFTSAVMPVEIIAGQEKKLDLPLQIATKEEKVLVESEATKVNTNPENNASSVVISGKDLDALSDDPDELQNELQALAGPSAGPNGGQIYIDGFTGGQLPPKSSIREIRINQNPFSAQYDRMGFGRIEILTKPGTDQPHGQFFYNDNHALFDAMNPFAAAEPDFSSEIFNGNVGGPLSKKASYFLNFERRDIQDAAIINGSAFSSAGLTPVAVSNPRVRMAINSRLDYQLTAGNTLMVRYQYSHNSEQNNGVGPLALPSQAYNQTSYEHTLQLSDTQVLNPHAVNETRFEFERGGTNQNSLTAGAAIQVAGTFTEGGNAIGLGSTTSDHYELQNYTSINRGQHFMRFGGRLRATSENINSTTNFNGTFLFSATVDPVTRLQTATALQNFAAGKPSQFTIAAGTPGISSDYVDAGLYAEDDWKIRPNMTLSYGLRFETQNGIGDHGDWAPRLGFAWGLDARKNAPAKTILRTGFGIFYDRFGQNLIVQAQRFNGSNQKLYTITLDPLGTNQAALSGLYASLPALPSIQTIAGLTTAGTTTYSVDPSLRAPYTMQAAASLERQLSKASTLSVTYVHAQGVHQLFSINNNAFLPGATPAYLYLSEGVFKQNQMITSFNMRVGTKVTVFSYYSLSYANGDSSGPNSIPSDPVRGITADYGRTVFDVRNRLFLGGTIALKYGFRASPFIVANSGSPFNITTGTDLNGDSIFNDRPALASAATLPGNLRETPWGNFDVAPGANDPRIPAYFGTSPALYTLNLRLSKTFGIGPKLQTTAENNPQQGRGQGSPGGGPGGGRGPGGPGGEHGGPGGRGPGGGPGGPMGGIFGGERSNQRYSLTFSVHARNILNHVNGAPPLGDLSSPEFGRSTSLAGGVFNTQSASRRMDFQVGFAF